MLVTARHSSCSSSLALLFFASYQVAAMARVTKSIAALSLASGALASPLIARQYNATSPCAQVASSVATQTADVPTVPAQLAYDCLTSVPFNQSAALALVDGVVPYFRWQSTTVWLKDPPKEYVEKVQPAVDIWGELDTIREKVVKSEYDNEYEVCIRHTKSTL